MTLAMYPSERVERHEVTVSDGTRMAVHVENPGGRIAPPGMIVLQEAFGVNEYVRQVVARFAGAGFAAVAPELYHRSGDARTAPYGDREITRELGKALTVAGQVSDVAAARDWLTREAGVPPDRVAVLGFCMGGRAAYLANAHLPLAAAISFYGGKIAPAHADLAPLQHGPLLMFWGGRDASIPKSQRRDVEDVLDAANVRHEHVIFSEAQHGFFGHLRSEYDPDAARIAWDHMSEFLAVTGLTPEPARV
jgi:carboxymethylenebutenolidase